MTKKLLGRGKMVDWSVDSKPKYFKGCPIQADEKSPVLGTLTCSKGLRLKV